MLQHRPGRHSSWAIAALFVLGSSLGCSDDSSDNDGPSAGKGGGGGSSSNAGTGGESNVAVSDELKGKGESCTSYTPVAGDKCQGWYCGVTEAELVKAVNPEAKCGGNIPLLCKGSVVVKVGMCARSIKAANFAASDEELRPKVRDCVYEDAEIRAAVPESCLNCTIDAAACAANNCLAQCIAGDSATCDSCRRTARCDQSVFTCGQLPAPID